MRYLLAMLLALLPVLADATTYHVDGTNGDNNSNGTSPFRVWYLWCQAGAKTSSYTMIHDDLSHHESSPFTDDCLC